MKTILSLSTACLICLPGIAGAKDEESLPLKYQRASAVLGKKVENSTGENLGKIEDVVLDTKSGRIAYAVLSFGGFLGIGDKLFVIPWQALGEDSEKEVCVLAIDKEKLKRAPGFDKTSWPDMADPKFRDEVHRFYDIPVASSREGWRVDGRSTEGGAMEDLRRETVELPLKLQKGAWINFQVECPMTAAARTPETHKPDPAATGRAGGKLSSGAGESTVSQLRLEVIEMTGDEATVEINCSGKETKSCTVRVAKDGTVHYDAAAAESTTADGKDAQLRLLVTHIFGQGLHGRKLEPGQEYTMPGSFHGLPHAEARSAGPSRTAAEGTHTMRFEGVTRKHGMELAVFSIPGSATTIQKAAGAVGEERVTGAAPEGVAGTRRVTDGAGTGTRGRAVYRLDDGCLQKLLFDGTSVHRLDVSSP